MVLVVIRYDISEGFRTEHFICGLLSVHSVNNVFSSFLRHLVWLWTASLCSSFSEEVRSLFPSIGAPFPNSLRHNHCSVLHFTS